MFTQSPLMRSRLIVIGSLSLLTVLIMMMGLKMTAGAQTQTAAVQVISAMRADFPDFCPNGQILATDEGSSYWGIKCDTLLNNPAGFYGDATIVDVAHCTTIRPLMGTLGGYYYEFEAINKSNGKKLAVCP